MKREEYPVSAMRFSADVQIEQSEESNKVHMLARSGKPIEHWFWGTIVHDNSGAKFGDSIPLDYCHLDTEVIGFARKADISVDENYDLQVNGTLTPFTENDRASEILHKAAKGVPYQASINFAGEGIKLERVDAGKTTEVNGFTFEGPGVVVREWPLRGIAVCPYGADANTKSEFSVSDTIAVTVLEKETMSDDVKDTPEAVETEVENTAQPEAAELANSDPRAEAKKFVEAFGAELGGRFYADGLSYTEAAVKALSFKDKHIGDLGDKIKQLTAEIDALKMASSEAVEASVEDVPNNGQLNPSVNRFKWPQASN